MIAIAPLLAPLGTFFVTVILSFKTWLLWLVGAYLVSTIVKALLAVGVGFATYKLGSFGLEVIHANILDAVSGSGARLLGFVSKAGVFEALAILFSAMSARLTITGLSKFTKK